MKAVLERKLDFIGYPNYSVDTEGNVWSYNGGKVRKLNGINDGKGYLFVGLFDNGLQKKFKVHRLVAMAFIQNPDNKPCIDHINTIRTDNRVSNLRWVTSKENSNNPITLERQSEAMKGENNPFWGKHHCDDTKRKLSESKKGKYCGENNPMFGRLGKNSPNSKVVLQYTKDGEFIAEYYGAAEAKRLTNINDSHIIQCCKGQRKSAGNFVWVYKKEND